MKFCTKCGNQMADDMVFCQKCGAKDISLQEVSCVQNEAQAFSKTADTASGVEQNNAKALKQRTGMKVGMILCFIFAGFFAFGSIAEASMLAGVCMFGVLGVMFLFLAKTPTGRAKILGLTKGAFVTVSIFLSLFLFIAIINAFDTGTTDVNKVENNNTIAVNTEENKDEVQVKKEPEIPVEFASPCPVTVSPSMYDNIIGMPELKCSIENNTDKEISAVQLYFLPKDVYGEKINSIFTQNKLWSDTPISANETATFVWQMLDQDVKSGDLYIYSVYFSDGTEWGDRNAPTSKIKKYAIQLQVSY